MWASPVIIGILVRSRIEARHDVLDVGLQHGDVAQRRSLEQRSSAFARVSSPAG